MIRDYDIAFQILSDPAARRKNNLHKNELFWKGLGTGIFPGHEIYRDTINHIGNDIIRPNYEPKTTNIPGLNRELAPAQKSPGSRPGRPWSS